MPDMVPATLCLQWTQQRERQRRSGVISSIGGPSQTWRGGKLDQVIRLDLLLHPVASGGAIVDASGKLIGIGTPVLSRVSVFAVPNGTVERVVRALLEHGRVPQGYLGAAYNQSRCPSI